ncbi:CHAP domain-containing protein [Sphingobium aquiterrae]|uniref:CHAP domain-containing protein n=1 Tax=Sphingobium aquiterrae TaxID=2038656 RepID=UPI003019C500
MTTSRHVAAVLVAAGLWIATPAGASDVLQCVPYARTLSGIDIRGDAWTWWDQAEGRFARGHVPRKGAVIAFQSFGPMPLGHVAVVSQILSDREILVRHANWSTPGGIETDVPVIDVSADGDWSQVRVWYGPAGRMGARTNPVYGFIYGPAQRLLPFTPGTDPDDSPQDGNDDLVPRRRYMAAMDAGAARPSGKPPRLKVSADIFAMEGAMPRGRQFAMADRDTRRALADIIADVKRDARLR